MDDLKKIVWLASYPKSGNTWFRVFLSNLLSKANQPVDINNLFAAPIASNRQLFDEATGLSSSDLTADEMNGLLIVKTLDGIRAFVDDGSFDGGQPAVVELLEQRQQPLLIGDGCAGL